MSKIMKKLKENAELRTSIVITLFIIAAILVMTFTQFKQLPFIYNEF